MTMNTANVADLPEMPADFDAPGINADLIRRYAQGANEWGIAQLITLFDHLRKCSQRAEYLSTAYLKRIQQLEARISRETTPPTIRTNPGEPSTREFARDLKRGREAQKAAPIEVIDLDI